MNPAHKKIYLERKQLSTKAREKKQKNITLSSILTSNPGLKIDNKIMCVERFISVIDAVKPYFRSVEILYLSNNCISVLSGIGQFSKLRVLSLNNNLIEDFQELYPLKTLKNLNILSLVGNPVSYLPYYRLCSISIIPQLKQLDAKYITDLEKEVAPSIGELEHNYIKTVWTIEVLVARISLGIKTQELRIRVKDGSKNGADIHQMAAIYLKKLAALLYMDTRDKEVRHALYSNYRNLAYKVLSERLLNGEVLSTETGKYISECSNLYCTIIKRLLSEAVNLLIEVSKRGSSYIYVEPHLENCSSAVKKLNRPLYFDKVSCNNYFKSVKFITYSLTFVLYRIIPQKYFRSMAHYSQTLIGLKTYGLDHSLEYKDRHYDRIKHMDFLQNSLELHEPTDTISIDDFFKNPKGHKSNTESKLHMGLSSRSVATPFKEEESLENIDVILSSSYENKEQEKEEKKQRGK